MHLINLPSYKIQNSIVNNIDKPLLEFLGNPPTTTLKLTEIKASMLEFATLQLKYEEHVKQFSNFRKKIVDKCFGTTIDKIDTKLPDIKKIIE